MYQHAHTRKHSLLIQKKVIELWKSHIQRSKFIRKEFHMCWFSNNIFVLEIYISVISMSLHAKGFLKKTYDIAWSNSCRCFSFTFTLPPSSRATCNSLCKTANLRRSPSKSNEVTWNSISVRNYSIHHIHY